MLESQQHQQRGVVLKVGNLVILTHQFYPGPQARMDNIMVAVMNKFEKVESYT